MNWRLCLPILLSALCVAGAEHPLNVTILNEKGDTPVPCRVHLRGPDGKAVRMAGLPFWNDHFVCTGRFEVIVAEGVYDYAVERGPEYRRLEGQFNVTGPTQTTLRLGQIIDLTTEGWWPGEVHVHRPIAEIPLLMLAEDLQIAPVITWWNKRNPWHEQTIPKPHLISFDQDRYYDVLAGEDERQGGALLFFGLDEPLEIATNSREFPSPMDFVSQARRHSGVWIDIEKPFWWDVPLWLASGQVDSIGLANNHMCRSQMYESEAWGYPRDTNRLAAPLGNGYWTQEIYYQILNSGLRIPPSAGSASGVLPNPVGYNRAYVHLDGDFTPAKWWEGLKAGRTFVSNGPLLRCRANNELPGHVFSSAKPLSIDVTAELTGQDPIDAIEIVRDGQVTRKIPFNEKAKNELGRLEFERSGWFLIRVIANNPKTFRFASTAPYYVEIGSSPTRVSRAAAQFFLDWEHKRMEQIHLTDPAQNESVLKHHRMAEKFWQEKVAQADSD